MKLLRKSAYAIVFTIICGATNLCDAQNNKISTTFQKQAPFEVNSPSFQEWYAGIKVGGTGINIFLPITDVAQNVEITEIYFRNLKGDLIKVNGTYSAQLKNNSPYYTFKKSEPTEDYPFKLKDTECVVAYTENGQSKYFKITNITEFAGTYYENGPPPIYVKENATDLVSVEDQEVDN
ncbi:hypothetical protein [Winogradskyella psychrotolerans]|uniref:hypothetical protein n=1 Tax=Winogradskyella psychrotolerans TaxID=1344585 RepID=UPI001C07095B|nr:hypothetical protein [Winogradskyella psychrotolerans]MBU2926815.1 hypothetical protein [Winogradskyella psychrotolerans]